MEEGVGWSRAGACAGVAGRETGAAGVSRVETCLGVVTALDARMRSASIDRVRVTDLCRDAGISRATFYENFQDVYAVATWMWDHLMSSTLYQAGVTLSCYEAHLRKFQVLQGHREFFGNAMRIVGYASICQHGGRRMHEHMERVFVRKAGRPLDADEALQLEFFTTGAKHMTRHWVEGGMVQDPARMACLFTGFVPAYMLPYLEPGELEGPEEPGRPEGPGRQ